MTKATIVTIVYVRIPVCVKLYVYSHMCVVIREGE